MRHTDGGNQKDVVLVAEDDDDLRDVMTLVLEGAGYNVMSASDGREALRLISEGMPDLILLDMKMPYLSGWEFAACYAATYPVPAARAPIVVVTAAEHTAQRAREIDAAGYLAKPFTPAELLLAVQRRLPGSSAGRR